ncbi:polysaccharide pyruvyl transferase family protein [Nocardia uniformis]|uniref:Polysaccharide pyruvyl transferase family protein n=1 Tax=Nocardia uniformis TaxID=53432 RepID=A0A849CAW6_9NOCA|nr:polysaccharide pyruvyl transferase family protein [Nocardia uniformis]NNH73097.1 polysaccharide pyruvyl transferase family protein [Nocardia uniformis]
MPASPLYYLVSPAGHPNYGDELIAAGWLRYLAETAPEATVWVDTHSPGPAQVLLGELHPRVRFTDTLWRLCWEAPSDDPAEVASWVGRAVGDPGMAPRWDRGIALLGRADVVHLLGGGYINRIWPRHIGLLAGAAAAVQRSGARGVTSGLGVFPEPPGSAELLRALTADFEIVDVRDLASAELLGSAVGVDDAFLADPMIRTSEDERVPEVMLCLQSDLLDIEIGDLVSVVSRMLRAWNVSPEQVGVVEAIPGVDRAVFDLIAHQLPGARFYPFVEVWEHGLPVSATQTWLTTRFHMHLVAAMTGAAGVAIPISADFYGTKHHSLVALGSGWTVLDDLSATPRRPVSAGFDTAVVSASRKAKRALADAIYRPGGAESAAGSPKSRRMWAAAAGRLSVALGFGALR